MNERTNHLEAVQRRRYEAMVALVAALDAATAMGEAAPEPILRQLDALLLAAVAEFEAEVEALLDGARAEQAGPVN